MRWGELASSSHWALAMMLVAILPTVAGVVTGWLMFSELAPPFVFVFPAVWLTPFVVGSVWLRAALIGGIVWGVVSLSGRSSLCSRG